MSVCQHRRKIGISVRRMVGSTMRRRIGSAGHTSVPSGPKRCGCPPKSTSPAFASSVPHCA
eukprot:3881358-Rhodomonas_salina.2